MARYAYVIKVQVKCKRDFISSNVLLICRVAYGDKGGSMLALKLYVVSVTVFIGVVFVLKSLMRVVTTF